MEYPALFEPSKEGGFVVTFLDFDWGVTQGETEQDAQEMALDALCMMMREHIRNGEHLPRPSKPRGRKYRKIRLPLATFRDRLPLSNAEQPRGSSGFRRDLERLAVQAEVHRVARYLRCGQTFAIL